MIIRNRAKGTEINRVTLCNSLFLRMRGLMFKKKGRAILEFKKEGFYGIWTLFMRFSLDLAFLDKNKTIKDLKYNIKPVSFNPKTWKVYYPQEKSKYVLEVEKGKLEGFSVGDKLEFVF